MTRTARRQGAFRLRGRAAPTFLLFSGAGVLLDSWDTMQRGIARFARSLAWNRPGLPGSPAPRGALSAGSAVTALRTLLDVLPVEPPYVLVGHSLGALQAQLFACRHPDDVAAVVLVEPTGADERIRLREARERLAAGLARMQRCNPEDLRANLDAELDALGATVRELDAAGPFPDVPLWVVVGRLAPPRSLASPRAVRERRRMQRRLLRLSPGGGRRVPMRRSGHFPQWSEPRRMLALLRVVAAQVRVSQPLQAVRPRQAM